MPINAVVETVFSGPVFVRILRVVEDRYGSRRVDVKVSKDAPCSERPVYRKGQTFSFPEVNIWKKHKFIGQFGTRSEWSGRPDLSSIPVEKSNHS